jgi:mannose-6-phosphate isomerase-like protein (cupin superfamily)
MYVTNVGKVTEHKIQMEGAHKVRVKYLLHKGAGAQRLQLRLFIIDVVGCTPLEEHAHEHEVFMLKGKALVRTAEREVEVRSGDVIFIPSYEMHQFRNIGNEPVEFLCTKETA